MRKAGFRYVFLGIENILEDDLKFLKASSKNTKRAEDAGYFEADSIRRIDIR